MAIKRYYAIADNTITDSYQENLTIRGTGSNMGQSDILETFSIYAQQSTTSSELARILVQFPVENMITDRDSGVLEASGSVSFYLKMTNARHSSTLPRDFTLSINAISESWEEGNGLDMESYSDLTYDFTGSNWVKRAGSTSWSSEGGSIHVDANSSFEQYFLVGDEHLEVDITTLVEQWIDSAGNVLGSKDNYGLMVKLKTALETASQSYYTKKFFARSSEFFFRRPTIEARWDSSRRDDRGNFYISSSLAPGSENLNTLYMYNYIRGSLRDIKGDDTVVPNLKLYYSSGSVPEGDARDFINSSNVTIDNLDATRVSTGLYKVQLAVPSTIVDSTYPFLVDVWNVAGTEVHTGSAMSLNKFNFSEFNPYGKYVISIPNLKNSYSRKQTERFRLYVRNKNWSPNVFTTVNSSPTTMIIPTASYQIIRISDEKIVIPYNTGSNGATDVSYDVSGNYFDLDMSMLEGGYTFGIQFSFYEDSISSFHEQPHLFRIRVLKDEY